MMPRDAFSHVETWVFDLDNTLYPPEARLFDQIEVRMTDWVSGALGVDRLEADRLRHHYWKTYGTTLAGLMAEHDVDPGPYLTNVHDISLDHITVDAPLVQRIGALRGRRIVYTNGSIPYAERVIAACGLQGLFDAVYGVESAAFHPKPRREAFEIVFSGDGLSPDRSAMFEDDPRNLKVPHEMGMITVHVAPERTEESHIHHHTDDLAHFLSQLA